MYNGIAVRDVPILNEEDEFEHETELIQSIREFISEGDDVVLVGAGSGVSSVSAAHQVGFSGSIKSFEAGRDAIKKCRDTFQLNRVSGIVDCRQAIVETPIHVVGDSDGAEQLSAVDLPVCDVLVLDCEGAEKGILKNIESQPYTIIVETHSHFDSSSDNIRDILSNKYVEEDCLVRSENIDILTFKKK